MKKSYIHFSLWALLATATPAFSQMPGSWTLNQNCNGFSGACSGPGISESSGVFQLTTEGSRTTNTMWNNTVFQMSQPWTMNFDVNFGTSEGEGFTFAIQGVNGASGNTTHQTAPNPNQLTSGGYGGGDLGVKCLQTGGNGAFPNNSTPANARTISVEFDVFDNTNGAGCTGGCQHAGDLAVDHIGINYDDCSGTSSNSTLGPAVPALPGGATIRDGEWRSASVIWTPDPPVSIGSKYDRYVGATDCLQAGTFTDGCGNTVAWSSLTCGAGYSCHIMAVNTGTLTVLYDGVVKQSVTLNLETLLNNNQGQYGPNVPRDVIFGFTATTEGKSNDIFVRNPVFLPVEFHNFNLKKAGDNAVLVQWFTVSEKNSSYFTIQRSLDGQTWQNISSVKAAGNSSSLLSYEFTDYDLEAAHYYYRIEETDNDGKKMYSEARTIVLAGAPLLSLYPNPAHDYVKAEVTGASEYTLELYDLNGIVHYTKEHTNLSEQNNTIDTKDLAAGIYFVKIKSGYEVAIQKLVIY
jgi:hypothetical protein